MPLTAALLLGAAFSSSLAAQAVVPTMPPAIANAGRYNVAILEGGTGMERDLTGAEAAVRSNAPWTLSACARPSEAGADGLLLAIGKPLAGNGDTKTFMTALDTMFGPGTSFADF